jgi:hypothetical protein
MNHSVLYLNTIQGIKESLDKNIKFVDVNNVLSLAQNKENIESVGAYITMYFWPYVKSDWDSLSEKINEIGSNCSNVLINYNEYSHLIGTENFQNIALDTINEVIRKSENLNKEIIILTETMKNKLLAIIVDNDIKIRKDF